jgi:hypothetical protein
MESTCFSIQNQIAPQMMDSTARAVHHLESYMMLTVEGKYCPSTGEPYDFDMRKHILSTIWGSL